MYDTSSTYVPNLSREQIDKLLDGVEIPPEEAPKVDRAQAKANTWQRVTKVVCARLTQLEGVRRKITPP